MLFNNHLVNTAGLPITPLSAGSMLIPFQPAPTSHESAPGYVPGLNNFERYRHQIQHRGQLLNFLKQQNATQVPANFDPPSRPVSPVRTTAVLPSSIPKPTIVTSSMAPTQIQPSVQNIQSRRSSTTSSEDSSSQSSTLHYGRLSTATPSGYAQPSFGRAMGGSSDPSMGYRSFNT
jgi:hypothetical protein